jgi:hypothetical protein
MESSISSKRSFTYYTSLLTLLFLILTGALFISVFFHDLATETYTKKSLVLIFAGFFIIAFTTYGIYIQLNKVPAFTVTKDDITVKGICYAIADITAISFTGKKNYGGINKLEGMQITFSGNKIFYVYDCYYSNIAPIKSYISNAMGRTDTTLQPSVVKTIHINMPTEGDIDYYKGSMINFKLLFIVAFIGFIGYLFISMPYKKGGEFIILVPVFFIIIFSGHFYYFGIGRHSLVVRSFSYFWYKRTYRLDDIKEILFESNGKGPHSITITMENFSYKKYYASTLYDKHWRSLKQHAESKGINVRDELGLG